MNRIRLAVGAALVLFCAASPTKADVLNFDDLNGFDFFTQDYHGFRFGNNDPQTNTWFYSNLDEPDFPPKSEPVSIATDVNSYSGGLFEPSEAITSMTPFQFTGAWFTGFDQVRFQLYFNGVLVATSATSDTLTRTPFFLTSGYAGPVDALVIEGSQGFYALDDFTFEPIPEPATVGLLLSGLGFLVVVRSRQRRSEK